MSNRENSINEVLANPNLLTEQNSWGFYDWFCTDKSLQRKAKSLLPKVKFLVQQGIVDGDKCYVWFKNNCPCQGNLYDDFRISTLEDSTYVCGCIPSSGFDYNKGACTFWTLLPDFDDHLQFNTWSEFKHEIKSNAELRIKLKELIATK